LIVYHVHLHPYPFFLIFYLSPSDRNQHVYKIVNDNSIPYLGDSLKLRNDPDKKQKNKTEQKPVWTQIKQIYFWAYVILTFSPDYFIN
jgi:hypothetical protein